MDDDDGIDQERTIGDFEFRNKNGDFGFGKKKGDRRRVNRRRGALTGEVG